MLVWSAVRPASEVVDKRGMALNDFEGKTEREMKQTIVFSCFVNWG